VVTSEKSRLTHDDLLALIGHELQHALEVLEHPEVIDVPTMEAMYRKIGIPIAGQRGFETSAARAAGTAVHSELIGAIQLPPGSVERLMRRSYVVDGSDPDRDRFSTLVDSKSGVNRTPFALLRPLEMTHQNANDRAVKRTGIVGGPIQKEDVAHGTTINTWLVRAA
jgi:hypothetical protein